MDASLLQTFKAAILAETDPAFVIARNANEHGAMAAFYNEAANPAFTVWRSSTPAADVFNAITWKNFTPADTPDGTALYTNRAYHALLCQQNIMILMQGASSIATGRANVRNLLNDALSTLYTAAGGASQSAGWLAVKARSTAPFCAVSDCSARGPERLGILATLVVSRARSATTTCSTRCVRLKGQPWHSSGVLTPRSPSQPARWPRRRIARRQP